MTRRTAIQTLAGVAAATVARAETSAPGPRWTLQYFYDRDQERLNINDFSFVTPKQGIAVGWVGEKKGKAKPMAVMTRDGGKTWELQPLPDVGISTFFLNESTGWLVGEKALWRTDEGGKAWKKLKLPKDAAPNRIYFLDENRGWLACERKQVLQTKDGGRTWSEVAAAEKPTANASYTSYNWIEFLNPKQGIIVGSSMPPRPDDDQHPAWMDPQTAAKHREWPSMTLSLETQDGGETWTSQTVPAFGQTIRYRPRADGAGLVLVRFAHAFDWPSEVYLMKTKGGGARVFREKNRVVTDCGWLTPQTAVLVAIEPPGQLAQLPVPGKLHVLTSEDMTNWTEMKVDYRAFGTRAMLSILNPDMAWVATDTGQILSLGK